ncbi:LysR family transcriptional regulator [Aquincola sp. MAHUQ-54]|uniref:LysR family transcriptional regulator n=1 Tax=Aquincola agrisoli TaxID=3119538 RepID=A0AAW9QHB6_9BURK
MTLVQLRHFLALADSGSFSQSAQRLFITQPALSRSIRSLEDELGRPLFDRIGRRSELTPFGQEMVPRARQLVADADEMMGSGRQSADGAGGSLRIGLGSGPGAMLMNPLLMHMATRHPELRLEVSRARTALLVQALRARALDALVVDARSLSPAPDLHVEAVQEMRGSFMCRPGHPLARRASVRFDDVRGYPIASIPLSDEVARVMVERYGEAAHPAACVTLCCEEIPSLVEVALHTDAVLVSIRAAAPGLVELPMAPTLDFNARFALVTLGRRTPVPALPIVRGLMQALMRDEAEPAAAADAPASRPGRRRRKLS